MTPAEIIIRNASALGKAHEDLINLYGELVATCRLPANIPYLNGYGFQSILDNFDKRFARITGEFERCLDSTKPLIVVTETQVEAMSQPFQRRSS